MDICSKLRVVRELLRLEEVIGEDRAQTIVRQVLQIPEEKPPAREIIDFTTTVSSVTSRVIPNKVIIEGQIRLTIVYEANVPEQTVHVAHFTIPFTAFVDVPGAEPGHTVFVTVRVEDVSFTVSPDGRTVTARIVIEVFAKVVRPADLKVVTDVFGIPGLTVTKETITAEDVLAEGENQIVLRETVTLPEEKPPAASIIDFSADATVNTTRVVQDKVIVEGTINIRVIYEAAVPEQRVHVAHFTVPFQGFVDIPGARPGMTPFVFVEVEFVSFDIVPPGRTITVRIILKIVARVVRVRTLNVVTDVRGIPQITVKKDLVRIQEVLGEQTGQSVVREILDIPDEKPPVATVLDFSATVTIDRTIVARGKVIVEGVINLRIMYEASVPQQTVNVAHFRIPFSDFVLLEEARPGMSVRVTGAVEFVSFDVAPPGDPIAVQIVLALTARLIRTRQLEIVTDVICVPVPVCRVTVTADRANVRSGPSLSFPVIAQLPRGATAVFIAVEGEWTRIRLDDGREGFIFSRLIHNPCIQLG